MSQHRMTRFRFGVLICLAVSIFQNEAVSDEEFQELVSLMHQQANIIDKLSERVKQLEDNENNLEFKENFQDIPRNNTIEERVDILEIQVASLDENVDFLLDEQIIQDQRLFELEQDADDSRDELIEINNNIEDLQDTTVVLDFRVTALEENGGGGGGNSSVAELEERVETLESTVTEVVPFHKLELFKEVFLMDGDEVQVVFLSGDDTTPLDESDIDMQNVFSGFRI